MKTLRIAVLTLLLVTTALAEPGTPFSSLSLAAATGAGQSMALGAPTYIYPAYTWQVNFKTAAPTAQTTILEGSIDGTNWYTLDTSTNLAYTSNSQSGEMRHVVNKPVNYLRCNLSAYTAGSNAGVTCQIYVTGFTR